MIDRLIKHFNDEYMQNKLVIGQKLIHHEEAFRLLASESRLGRQLISAAFHEIWNESTHTFWTSFTNSPDLPGIVYLWMTYPEHPEGLSIEVLEENLLQKLSLDMHVTRAKCPEARRIFGICLPNKDCTQTSYLVCVMDGENWTPADQQFAEELERNDGILSNIQTTQHLSSR